MNLRLLIPRIAQSPAAREWLPQKMLAERWHVQQPSIAKRAKRTGMHISTLQSHIEAMGGQLEVVARFQDGSVKISNVAESEAAPQQAQVFDTLSTVAIAESKNPRNSLGKSGV